MELWNWFHHFEFNHQLLLMSLFIQQSTRYWYILDAKNVNTK